MSENRSIKKNFIWQVGIEITNMLLPLVTSPILARRMGAETLGIYSYVYTVTYYFLQIALLGMFQYGTREIAVARDNKTLLNKKFSELFCFQLIHGSIVLIVFLLYSVIFSKYTVLMLIQTIYFLGASVLLINYVFTGLEEFNIIAVKTMIIRAIGVILIFTFVQTKEDLPLYTLIMAAEPMAGALVYISLAKRRVKLVKVNLIDVFKHIKGLYMIFIPILATFLYATMDKLMLGNMCSMEQLGFYSNAEKALIAKNLAVALSVVLVPRMSKLAGDRKSDKFNELLDKSLEVILLLTIAFGFGTAGVSSSFSVVFWGKNFIDCSSLIQVMSFTLPAYGLTYVINNQYLVPLKKESIYIRATVFGVFANLLINFILIPSYGAYGAAIATLATQYIVLIIECIAIRTEYSIIPVIRNAVPYVLFALLMYFSIKYIDNSFDFSLISLVMEIVVGSLIFLAFCIGYWILFKKEMYLSIIQNVINQVVVKLPGSSISKNA
ncbi:oligosaccharide flippase family protein [Butyrivibrio sp. WCE2006]|uniref:oligosaccharide flippase family protein n=1 Tax=Butyrivibrio sp. WCE2006 TaxID=1410611 RepID=UPI0005D14EF9|nr:oligosaccharide flippase family protein [Butyrivibrio sp. WCE2006]